MKRKALELTTTIIVCVIVSRRIFNLKMHQIVFAVGATSPQTPLGELTAFLQTPIAGFKGGKGSERKG